MVKVHDYTKELAELDNHPIRFSLIQWLSHYDLTVANGQQFSVYDTINSLLLAILPHIYELK